MNKTDVNPQGVDLSALMTRPEKIAIVALGPSAQSFVRRQMSDVGVNSDYDEVWTLNRGIKGFHHDKLFVMDDLKWIENHRNKNYADFLKNHDKPIITSTPYFDYPTSIPFPLKECIDFHDDDIFAVNTVSYMVAYALYIGVKDMHIFGADFVYKNGTVVEEGAMAVSYMLGRCKMHDCIHTLTNDTTLIYANKVQQFADGGVGREPYGYHRVREMNEMAARDKVRKEQQKSSVKELAEFAKNLTPSGEA
jgi:hypothetical protein